MTPFITAMTAALAHRLEATTLMEKHAAEDWIAAIIRAQYAGEDVSQFIPRVEPEPFDARMAQAGKEGQ